MTIIFDGKKLAAEKEKILAKQGATFRKKFGIPPKLVAIIVGGNPASRLYLKVKEKAAKRVGIDFEKKEFPVSADPEQVILQIKNLNSDESIHGILVQLPLPKKLSIIHYPLSIIGAIAPSKDVDCLTPGNLGRLMIGQPRFLPATVKAVIEIITIRDRNSFASLEDLKGKNVVVVGAGNLVGKPLAIHLKNLGATVTVCDEFTKNLAEFTKKAEILISATGIPGLIKKEMVKKGAVVIDVGSPKPDVDFKNVAQVASFITPVPGGVGPMTVVSLLENLLEWRNSFFYEDP